MQFIIQNASVSAVGVMVLLMFWYWLVAYKYNIFHIHWLPSMLIGIITPFCLLCSLVGLSLISAFSGSVAGFLIIENIRWLPLVSLVLIVTTYGAIFGSVLGSFAKSIKDKHKVWYAFGMYQLLMMAEILIS